MTTSLLDRIAYVRPDRLRAPWRILLFLLAGFAASNVAVPLLAMTLPAASMPWLRPTLECLAVLFATRYASFTIDKRNWSLVGLGAGAWRPTTLALGLLAGVLAIGVPTGLLIARGDLTFVPAPGGDEVRTLLFSVAFLAPAALTEELLMRGYPFAVLRETWGWPLATAVTSIVFGLLHRNNPGVTPIAMANVISAGVFLAGVRIVTGSLAAAWAAHFMWNWTMSAGFHTAVSGLPFGTPGYRLVDTGPDWLSGGAWGPEGGAIAALGMIGTFAGLSWVTGRSKRAGIVSATSRSISSNAGAPLDTREHEA
ncbi:MAG: CPBP family intramembrane metalloprotease [Gemmatimonadaceae bacterium]|nr:CPBP family intramembrane metalloprotease [Gemmatimonadaceae bacterium]